MSVGAAPAAAARLVVLHALRPLALGLALGLALAAPALGVLQGAPPVVGQPVPPVLAACGVGVLVGLAASMITAKRAAAVAPMVTLRGP